MTKKVTKCGCLVCILNPINKPEYFIILFFGLLTDKISNFIKSTNNSLFNRMSDGVV